MSITVTLFGGLIAVAAIFLTARKVGLSTYWGGVLSVTLPFFAYLGVSMAAWPGGDVIAIHLVVFIATAGVLGTFGGQRKNKEKMHWAPKLIIAFFCTFVLLMAALLAISMNGLPDWIAQRVLPHAAHKSLHTGFPGPTPHDQNKLYEQQQQRIEAQRKLGWQLKVEGLEHLQRGVAAEFILSITDAHNATVHANSATLDLWRIADPRGDRRIELAVKAPGVFYGSLTFNDAGRWVAEIYVKRGKDSYLTQLPFIVAE
jgi:nitrogen fixation protein FixH